MASKQEIASQYENFSIYVLLNTRGALPGFHWGLFIPTNTPDGLFWHAINREGGWKLEHRSYGNVPFSMSLVLAYKIGSVNASNFQKCKDILNSILADGTPSPNTGEAFSCRIWVKDAITGLEKGQIITLESPVSDVMGRMADDASNHKDNVEANAAKPLVVN
ncbi:hypothetical protein FQN57_004813 [Myotisia sp. PD_48]|nr:hypothetical protein FQN57_004813 [Myotisia sp. PD_48]